MDRSADDYDRDEALGCAALVLIVIVVIALLVLWWTH